MICYLTDLYLKQKELDEEIALNHHIDYPSTRNKRILALLVEIGEFANTTRAFKFWSNKGMDSKDVILDEYADGLHFILSLGLDLKFTPDTIEVIDDKLDLSDSILYCYQMVSEFIERQNPNNYLKMFMCYLRILFKLNYSWEDVSEAYYIKLKTNHHRQENNY